MASSPYFINNNMATITQRFGTRLRKLRDQKRMSQLELAQRSKLDLTTINEIENGNRSPMLKTMWRIANALDITVSHLVDF
jgi:transcriptional regulator with XRE-family HTH domain